MSAVQLNLLTTTYSDIADAVALGPTDMVTALATNTGVQPVWYADANTNGQLEGGEILYSDSGLTTLFVPSSLTETSFFYYVEDNGGFGPHGYGIEIPTDQNTNPTGEV